MFTDWDRSNCKRFTMTGLIGNFVNSLKKQRLICRHNLKPTEDSLRTNDTGGSELNCETPSVRLLVPGHIDLELDV